MKNLIRLEELAFFAGTVVVFNQLGLAWWWFLLLLFTPDMSMLGYLAGPRLGAWAYNLVHHRAVSLLIFITGMYLASTPLKLAGIILFAHSSLDRVFGYGLKFTDAFQHTHLGWIGPNRDRQGLPSS